jgi:MerR family mercuric resistance operon transcriptional regulator
MLTRARGITAGQLAKAAGVNLETIRYYETIGLMPAPPRTSGRHRVYDDAHVRRLAFIRRGRDLGFSIEGVRALLILNDARHDSCAEAKTIAISHLNQVRHKLADLTRLESILSASVDRCTSEPLGPCPVLDMLEL